MDNQGQQTDDEEASQPDQSSSAGTGTVGWQDIFGTDDPASESVAIAADHRKLGEADVKAVLQARTKALGALKRATELFVGLSEPDCDSIRTYVTELPQWFQYPSRTEVKLRVGTDVFETDSFCQTDTALTAAGCTRTGTRVSMTIVYTDQRPDTGQSTWPVTERELVETLVLLIKGNIDRREIDSLKRVSDGVIALDSELQYTYVNPQAEEILGEDGDELLGESVWDVFPEAADTVAEEKIQTALETQSPTSYERYNSRKEQWVEARIYPSEEGAVIAFSNITGSKESEREIDHVLETAPVGIVLMDDEGEITRANSRAEQLLGLSKSNIEGVGYDYPGWDIWDEAGNPIPPEDHPATDVLATGEAVQGFTHGITLPDGTERWLSSNVAPIHRADGSIEQLVVALEDVTVLKSLEQLIETFQPVDDILNSAATRQETEQSICELLTETREYQYARISEHTPGTALTESSIQRRPENVSCDGSVSPPVQSRAELEPARVAIETGEMQAVTATGSQFESWRQHTRDQGFQGGAIVPLRHRNRVYGLLVLYTDRGEAFGNREQTLLTTLGDRIGQVLHTLETERVLHADRVAELTFQSTDQGSFFVSASDRLDCTIDIVDSVPASDETLVHYASVRGASLDALDSVVEDADGGVQLRQIRHTEDPSGGDVEIELRRQSLAHTLVTMGGVVTTDTVTDGQAEVVCEVPLGHDIDSLVTGLADSFPETTFVSKREFDRAVKPGVQSVGKVLGDIFRAELTDRQRQVLRAALYSGYFESPRQSTATEIATALSLTQSTFSYHLRNAQETLFKRLFDRLQQH